MKLPYSLALDIGTSSVRAAIYDSSAHVLPATLVRNARHSSSAPDAASSISVEQVFSQVIQVIDDVLKKFSTITGDISYLAISSFWHSLMGVDKNGAPTTELFTWFETRPAKYIRILRSELNEKAVRNRTGCYFHSSYWTAKLLWLRRKRPKRFQKTARWISFSDYIAFKLFGEMKTSVSMASGTGIFNIRKNVWDSELLNYLQISEEILPSVIESDHETFKLNEEYSERWRLLKNTSCFLAIGDGAANNIGSGCVTKEKASLMIGASSAMRVAFEGSVPNEIPKGLWCYRIDRKQIIIGGALSDGGGLYKWLKENLRLRDNNDFIEREIGKRKPDGHGLTFLPFFAGERSTGYHEFLSGAILGIKTSTDAVDIVQAAFESIGYQFTRIYNSLNKFTEIKQIIASGGALRKSDVWTQILCDVIKNDINLPNIEEASSRGAVFMGLKAVGKIEDLTKVPKGKTFKFNAKNSKLYRTAKLRHIKFYKLLIDSQLVKNT